MAEGLSAPDQEVARPRTGAVAVVLFALFFSGTAGVANQVLWQRALKIFLGGSETLSSLVVVLVFMLGLGVGAELMGARVWRSRNPVRLLGLVELALVVTTLGIGLLFRLDIRESVYAFQRFALSIGVPLRAVYAVGATLILLPPTILMGATVPIASEACQRQLGASRSSLVAVLFVLNTLGAVVGAFASSFYFLPVHGQTASLGCASLMNLGAAVTLLALAGRLPPAKPGVATPRREKADRLRPEELAGMGLGFLSTEAFLKTFDSGSTLEGTLAHR